MTGIYVHVPFCLRKCPYCDFYSRIYDEDTAQMYTEAVCRNIAALAELEIHADTIYFGGGTPSLLTVRQIERIINAADKNIRLFEPEITLEANPSSTDFDKLCGYRAAGVNRLSFGVQSADDSQLKFLGRLHSADTAWQAVENAARAGFDNISCDLMIGLAGQNLQSLDYSLDSILRLPVSHISAYMLKIEQSTPFDNDHIRALIADDDEMSELYLRLCKRMSDSGFEHYEISNFARNGARSRHNMKYWQLEEYVGIGPAAHSDFHGERFYCPPDIHEFIDLPIQRKISEDSEPDRLEEYVMLSLRLSDGLDRSRLETLGGEDFAAEVFERADRLVKYGLVLCDNDRLHLTDRGFLLSNSVICNLLGG